MRLLAGGSIAALCLAAAVLGLAACGSSGGGSDFAAEANAICKRASEESLAIYRSAAGSKSGQQAAIELQKRYLALDERTTPKMEALEPPAAEKKAFDGYLAAIKTSTAGQEKILDAAKEGNPKLYTQLNGKGKEEGEAVHRAAAAVGLGTCAAELPQAEAEEVAQTIEKNETEANPAQCSDYFTSQVVKAEWKTEKACREFQEKETAKEIPNSVDVKVTEGVAGLKATAELVYHGGILDGRKMEYGMLREGGAWMVAYAAPIEG